MLWCLNGAKMILRGTNVHQENTSAAAHVNKPILCSRNTLLIQLPLIAVITFLCPIVIRCAILKHFCTFFLFFADYFCWVTACCMNLCRISSFKSIVLQNPEYDLMFCGFVQGWSGLFKKGRKNIYDIEVTCC